MFPGGIDRQHRAVMGKAYHIRRDNENYNGSRKLEIEEAVLSKRCS